jgi:UDP-GlcNAc:undecaprenyl-phosphate GlcNAc-1-phosphate transferase
LGGVLGFLKFNSHPARLFMGDTGSLMLGFSIAAISIILATYEPAGIKPVSIAIILALPIIDTMWVMTRRVTQGRSLGSPDNTHLHHRLLDLGLPHSAVVVILYTCVVMFGVLALAVKGMPEYWQFTFAIMLSTGLYSLLALCEYKSVCLTSNISFDEKGEKGMLANVLGRSMRLLPYVIFFGLSLPLLIADSIPESLGKLVLGLVVFIAVAFPWRDYYERLNIVYGLFYLCGFTILYAWNVSTYQAFDLEKYTFLFGGLLLVWSLLKVKFKRRSEVFFTSNFELLLIFISWFVPYLVLPALEVPEPMLHAAKLACLGAIPLLIAMKLVIKRQPHRNREMAVSLVLILGFIAVRAT